MFSFLEECIIYPIIDFVEDFPRVALFLSLIFALATIAGAVSAFETTGGLFIASITAAVTFGIASLVMCVWGFLAFAEQEFEL